MFSFTLMPVSNVMEMTRIAEDVRGGDGERTKVCERIAKWSIFRGVNIVVKRIALAKG